MAPGAALQATRTKGIAEVTYSQVVRTICGFRERVTHCEALREFAAAEEIREILRQEQEHAIDLATALREDVPAI